MKRSAHPKMKVEIVIRKTMLVQELTLTPRSATTQRYRCFGCRRTFNDLTRTAIAGTHLPEKWRAYADTMRDGLSTRKAAERIGVEHKTAWRWRHKVTAFLAPAEQPAMSGIVEADETYFRRNYKGSTPVGRRARQLRGDAQCGVRRLLLRPRRPTPRWSTARRMWSGADGRSPVEATNSCANGEAPYLVSNVHYGALVLFNCRYYNKLCMHAIIQKSRNKACIYHIYTIFHIRRGSTLLWGVQEIGAARTPTGESS